MKRSRLLVVVFAVLLLALGSFSFVLAQDSTAAAPLPSVALTMWTNENDDKINGIFKDLFNQWATENSPGSTIDIQYLETETLRNNLLTAGLAGTTPLPRNAYKVDVARALLRRARSLLGETG